MITVEAKEDFTRRLDNQEALWLTVFGEARSESPEGQIAVANVILNRSIEQRKSVKDVCLASLQFSCWNRNDPNLDQLMNAYLGPSTYSVRLIKQIKHLTYGVYMQFIMDNTDGSNHYLTLKLYNSDKCPVWAKNKDAQPRVAIGSHMFLWCP
tara:strand:- start:455 stop:913 length:459 start_codon:yes stop_codon:yes gene_type:complete